MITLIFDMDGTITDSFHAIVCAVNELRAGLNLPPLDRKYLIKAMNDPSFDFDKKIFLNANLPQKEAVFNKHYKKNVILFEGLYDLLLWAKSKKMFLAVATNATHSTTQGILSKLDVLHFFDEILCAGDGYQAKPSPMMPLQIMANSPYKRGLFIGDSDKDAEAAKGASLDFIKILWYQDAQVNDAKTLKIAVNEFLMKE